MNRLSVCGDRRVSMEDVLCERIEERLAPIVKRLDHLLGVIDPTHKQTAASLISDDDIEKITREEARAMLGVSMGTIDGWRRKKIISSYPHGIRGILVSKQEILEIKRNGIPKSDVGRKRKKPPESLHEHARKLLGKPAARDGE